MTLSHLFARLFPKLPSRATREHAYLCGAANLYDLECREREIERGKFAGV